MIQYSIDIENTNTDDGEIDWISWVFWPSTRLKAFVFEGWYPTFKYINSLEVYFLVAQTSGTYSIYSLLRALELINIKNFLREGPIDSI